MLWLLITPATRAVYSTVLLADMKQNVKHRDTGRFEAIYFHIILPRRKYININVIPLFCIKGLKISWLINVDENGLNSLRRNVYKSPIYQNTNSFDDSSDECI